MKNNYFLPLCVFFISFLSFAQEAPILSVDILTPVSPCNPGDCTELTADYFITKSTTSYKLEPIVYQNLWPYSGGTLLVVTTDDVWSPTFTLPFAFNFYGQSYNKVLVGSNGAITFDIAGEVAGGTQVPAGSCLWQINSGIPSTSFVIKNAIYGVFQDTNLNYSAITDPNVQNINYYVGGVAPNRYFVANFNRLPQFQCGGSLGASVEEDIGLQTSQVVIYETTNIIDIYVRKKTACAWNNGNAVIGIQNKAGTAGVAPIGRNAGPGNPSWIATQEAYRFTPNGANDNLVTLKWKNSEGTVLGTSNPLTVCVADANEVKNITAEISYTNGTLTSTATDNIDVALSPPLPVLDPVNLAFCNTNAPPFTVNINQDAFILDGASNWEYEILYFTNQAAAEQEIDGQAIPSSQLSNYVINNTNPVTIYALIRSFSGSACFNVRPFTVQVTNSTGIFSYPLDTDGSPTTYCFNSNSALAPVLADLTPGGIYTVTPGNPGDVLNINATTGVLNLTGATSGTYQIAYTLAADPSPNACPEFSTSTTISIESCIEATVSNSGPLCEGAPTFDLYVNYSETEGVSTSYKWKDSAGLVVSTVQNPTGLSAPAAAGSYTYSLVITQNGSSSEPFSTVLTVHSAPSATFVSVSSAICTNTTAILAFAGTPNAIVSFSDGSSTFSVVIDASGNGTFLTPALANSTTYTLLDVTGVTVPACSTILSGSVVISVASPTAVLVGFTNPVICSGTATELEISGTPGSTVSYTKNGVVQNNVILPASGIFILDTGIQTVATTTNYMYQLTNVTSATVPSCSTAISGQTATLTVNALPTATIATSASSICSGTTAILTFTGTPNATLTYTKDGVVQNDVLLPASGIFTITTGVQTVATITNYMYQLTNVVTNTVPSCFTAISGQTITLAVNPLPTANISTSATSICSGMAATLTFTGTPNATVLYSKNGLVQDAVFLPASGVFTLDTGVQTVATTTNYIYQLTNVVTNTVPSCSTAISGQTITLTVNPLPTANISASASSICSGTAVTLTFTGTPNATVLYSKNGVVQDAVVLPASGVFTIDTGIQTVTTTTNYLYEIITVEIDLTSCSNSIGQSATVTVTLLAAPTGTAMQDFTAGQTLADFTVIAESGAIVIWYSDATGTIVLPLTTALVSGTTYYASQTVNGCESILRLAVTAGSDLKTADFDFSNLRYSPNPVRDILTVDYSEAIQEIHIYNMLGQLVYSRNPNESKVRIDMAGMANGTYLLQVDVKGITKHLKVIKE